MLNSILNFCGILLFFPDPVTNGKNINLVSLDCMVGWGCSYTSHPCKMITFAKDLELLDVATGTGL